MADINPRKILVFKICIYYTDFLGNIYICYFVKLCIVGQNDKK